jgi:hypothetical protein
MRMHKKEAKQQQVEADIRLKSTSNRMQCSITTQHINEGAPWVLAKIRLRRRYEASMQSHGGTK